LGGKEAHESPFQRGLKYTSSAERRHSLGAAVGKVSDCCITVI
jgi:hypothetical protein